MSTKWSSCAATKMMSAVREASRFFSAIAMVASTRGSTSKARAETVPSEARRSSHLLRPMQAVASLGLALALVESGYTADVVTYYYTNPQGTVLATADSAGSVSGTADYRPYGGQALGAAEDGPGYSGHVNDINSTLVYMQARYYDPVVGRFLSIDPKLSEGGDLVGFSRYAYVGNNPITNTDPDGRQCAQCLYYPGDIERQGRINQGASEKALQITANFTPVVGAIEGVAAAVAQPSALNLAAAAIGIVPEGGAALGAVARSAGAAERAVALAAALPERTARGTTIAVTETAEGVRVVSSSEGYLRTSVQDALQSGEVYGKGTPRVHAEVNGVNAARKMGLTPTGTAASRPICSGCAETLQKEGVKALSPLRD